MPPKRSPFPSALHATRPATSAARTPLNAPRVARPGSLIFLISDFRRLGPDAERDLHELAGHCDLLLVHVYDDVEVELPPPGRYRIESAGRSFTIETGNDAMRRRYRDRFAERRRWLQSLTRRPGIRLVDCPTDAEPRNVLAQQFRQR